MYRQVSVYTFSVLVLRTNTRLASYKTNIKIGIINKKIESRIEKIYGKDQGRRKGHEMKPRRAS